MRIIKRRILIAAFILLFFVVLAFLFRSLFSESNMEKYTTVEQLRKSDVTVGDKIFKDSVAGWEGATKEEELAAYMDALTVMPDVLIVEPTENIECTYRAIMQEIKIVQVLKGDAAAGDVAECIFEWARIETKDDGNAYLMSYGVNLMQAGRKYLLFCERTDMSNYSSTDYYRNEPGIAYFDLSDDYIAASVISGGGYKQYSEVSSFEFFAESEEAADAIVDFKKELMGQLRECYSF